jgi:hypothetical protein
VPSCTCMILSTTPDSTALLKELEAGRSPYQAPGMNAITCSYTCPLLPGIRSVRMLAASVLLMAVAGVDFAAEVPAPKKLATVEGITEYQFENGLHVLLFPDNSQSKVTVNLTVLVG